MNDPTLHQLRCFDAVVSDGSFQAAAAALNRTHPSVYVAIKALEDRLGIRLFDRAGYRVTLTPAGRSFHARTRVLLGELESLRSHAAQLARGEETALTIVIGDLCPLPETLGLLRRFFEQCPNTRLHLRFEALAGPLERLLDGDADLILHHIDKSDPRLDFVDLDAVRLIPVVAPGFLAFPVADDITPERMRDYPQCLIRDTARRLPHQNHYIIEGARHWTVSDQLMKREIILQGMGWGHLPTFLIARDLEDGRLLPITGPHLPGGTVALVAARLRSRARGPIADRLWRHIREESPVAEKAENPPPGPAESAT